MEEHNARAGRVCLKFEPRMKKGGGGRLQPDFIRRVRVTQSDAKLFFHQASRRDSTRRVV